MRSNTARAELVAGLRSLGVWAGHIELATIWPVVAAWWRTSVDDVAPDQDERSFLLSVAPARIEAIAAEFADGGRVETRIRFVEQTSGVFDVAARESARALALVRDDPSDLIMLGGAH
jgi:hypothetical protein